MANNTISFRNTELFDKGAIAESMPYIKNGLTYKSNNTSIHPRDEAGNIVFQENSETNPLLIIEPVTPNISTKSVLRVVDTSFQYFKFPVAASIDAVEIVTSDLELDLTDIDFDTIYARYKPATDLTVASGSIYSGILMDEVVEGLPQTDTNCYTVSKEAKNSGKDLRFRVKIAHNFNSSETYGTIYWSIMKTGPDTGGLIRDWRSGFASSTTVSPTYNAIKDVNAKAWMALTDQRKKGNQFRQPYYNWSTNFQSDAAQTITPIDISITRLTGTQLDIINKILELDPKSVPDDDETTYKAKQANLQTALDTYNESLRDSEPIYGSILQYTTQNTYIDETISNSDFEIGDIFQIGVFTKNTGHIILNNQTYWVITDASKTVDEWNQEIIE
jgi:hypothetical protein